MQTDSIDRQIEFSRQLFSSYRVRIGELQSSVYEIRVQVNAMNWDSYAAKKFRDKADRMVSETQNAILAMQSIMKMLSAYIGLLESAKCQITPI